MFADNGRISRRQYERQILMNVTAVFLLFLTKELAAAGGNAIVGLIVGYGILCGAIKLLDRGNKTAGTRNAAGTHNAASTHKVAGTHSTMGIHNEAAVHGSETKTVSTAGNMWLRSILVRWPGVLFRLTLLVLAGTYILRESVNLVTTYLLPDVPAWLSAAILLVTAGIGAGTRTEARARMGEVLYPILMGGIVLLLILATAHAGPPKASQMPVLSLPVILTVAWGFASLGIVVTAYSRSLPICRPSTLLGRSARPWGLAALLLGWTTLVLSGTYGYLGTQSLEHPLMALLSGTNLPGKFLERFDILWAVFFLTGILCALGAVLYHGARLLSKKRVGICGAYPVAGQILTGVLIGIWWVTVSQHPEWNLSVHLLIRVIYAPCFLLFGI